MKCKGDFGGISYTTGDFVTPGTSGLGSLTAKQFNDIQGKGDFGRMGSMGTSLNDVFAAVFGDASEEIKNTLQSGASSLATNIVGNKLATDPNAKQGVVDTAKAAISQIYQEYKVPVLLVGGGLSILAVAGLYNTFKKR